MKKIGPIEYVRILNAGIVAENLRSDGFAAACYNDNSVDELLAALRQRAADKTDCKNWGITPTQWRSSIQEALAGMAFDYEFENEI